MNRKQLACYSLLASAVVLAAILVVQLNERVAPAQAEMVLGRNNLSMMTAKTAQGEEALFVLDNVAQRMLVYTVDLRGAKGDVQPQVVVNLPEVFGAAAAPAGAAAPRRSR